MFTAQLSAALFIHTTLLYSAMASQVFGQRPKSCTFDQQLRKTLLEEVGPTIVPGTQSHPEVIPE